jgi:hypothetical protein
VTGWIVLAVIVALVAVGLFVLFRSLRRWKQTPPRSPEARQADARLWQVDIGDHH